MLIRRISILILCLSFVTLVRAQWTETLTPAFHHLYAIEVVNNDLVFAGGYGGPLIRSTDGGEQWEEISIPNVSTISSIHFFDTTNGWMVASSSDFGVKDYLLKTTDGGDTWTTMSNSAEYSTMDWLTDQIGHVGTWAGTILKTEDGGETWEQIATPVENNIYQIKFIDTEFGYACSTTNKLMYTEDGGASWTVLPQGGISKFFFFDKLNGFVTTHNGRIGKTIDGGLSYTFYDTPYPDYKLRSVFFTNALEGYVIGGLDCSNGTCTNKPALFKTVDGGVSWTEEVDHPFEGQDIGFYGIDVAPNGVPYIAASDRFILTNGSFTNVNDLNNEQVLKIFPNPSFGKIVVEIPEGVSEIKAYRLDGTEVFRSESGFSKTEQIDLSHLGKGIFILTLFSEDEKPYSKRVIIN